MYKSICWLFLRYEIRDQLEETAHEVTYSKKPLEDSTLGQAHVQRQGGLF